MENIVVRLFLFFSAATVLQVGDAQRKNHHQIFESQRLSNGSVRLPMESSLVPTIAKFSYDPHFLGLPQDTFIEIESIPQQQHQQYIQQQENSILQHQPNQYIPQENSILQHHQPIIEQHQSITQYQPILEHHQPNQQFQPILEHQVNQQQYQPILEHNHIQQPILEHHHHIPQHHQSLPQNHIHAAGEHNLIDYSYTIGDHSYPVLIRSPKTLAIPVAREMLFTTGKDGSKYVPFDNDHRSIYSQYLNAQLIIPECQNYVHHSMSPNIKPEDQIDAFSYADQALRWYEEIIKNDAIITGRSTEIPQSALPAKYLEYASQLLVHKKCISKYHAALLLPTIDVQKVLLHKFVDNSCTNVVTIKCNAHSKYRTADGSCTNLANPTWGKSFTCHRRLLPPDYADGIQEPRTAHNGSPLPNPRLLSQQLLPDIPLSDHKLTSMTMSWGQFIVHDITRTIPFGTDIQCCPSSAARHPECMPIEPLPHNDFLFRRFNQTCINFVRSITCNPCSLGPREQQNEATQVFDLSNIYGLTLNTTLQIRSFRKGKLKTAFDAKNHEIQPPRQELMGCNLRRSVPIFRCFQNGDGVRGSQHPALQSLHNLFLRRHNQHAEALSVVNPHWDDERLFQESRRILVAESNKIVFGEYLPAVMGKGLTKHFGLDILRSGYSAFDPSTNPATVQEYIVAGGRFGHSQINDLFNVLLGEQSYSYRLRDNFFETTSVNLGHTDGIISGLISDQTSSVDPFFVSDVKNFVLRLRNENFGRDLPAFNIFRGREHGVPAYVYYLDYCFGFKVKEWTDLYTFIPKEQLSRIQQFYKHWKDIDLFVGGISERRISDAAFGPTFACINGIQFYHFKYGDRFYFEHGHQPGAFTLAQLDNIRATTSLASVICKTAYIKASQPNVFFYPSHHNLQIPCHMYPELDYSLWSEVTVNNVHYVHMQS